MVLNCLNKIFLFTGVFSLAANFLAILEILVPIHVLKKKEIFASVKTQWKLFPSKNNRSFLLNYKTKKKTLNILFCFNGVFPLTAQLIHSYVLEQKLWICFLQRRRYIMQCTVLHIYKNKISVFSKFVHTRDIFIFLK